MSFLFPLYLNFMVAPIPFMLGIYLIILGVRSRLTECLETILNKAGEPLKSKKVQHSNAKNAVLFEAISLIIHNDSEPNLLVRACNQLGQFLSHRLVLSCQQR